MSGKKKILIICFKGLKASRRSYRQILALKDDYEVHTLGYDNAEVEGVHFYEVAPAFRAMTFFEKLFHAFFFLIGNYMAVYHRIYKYEAAKKALKGKHFDLVIIHDLKPFPLFDELEINAPVICDAHEYYYDRNGGTLLNRLLLDRFDKYLLKKYFEKQRYIITVGEWIAEQFRRIVPSAQVEVVTSAADFVDLQPKPVSNDKIRIIHHGLVDSHRKTHLMVEIADYLDSRFTLDLMLVKVSEVQSAYYDLVKEMCDKRSNVNLLPPVKPNEIIPFGNAYDIGLFILPPDRQTHLYALPNKFYEYIQSRLMLAVSPNPEMAKIVAQYNLGVVSNTYDPLEMAEKLNALSANDIAGFKQNTHNNAALLSADSEKKKLLLMVKQAIGSE